MDISSIFGAYETQQANDIFAVERKKDESATASIFDSHGDTVTLSQEARDLAMQMRAASADDEKSLKQEHLEESLRLAAEYREENEKKAAGGSMEAGDLGSEAAGGNGAASSGSSDTNEQIEKLEAQIAQVSSQLGEVSVSITAGNISEKAPRISALQSQLVQLQQQLVALKASLQSQ